MKLISFGWNDRQQSLFSSFQSLGYQPGRVIRTAHSRLTVLTADGVSSAGLAGHLDGSGEPGPPAVGDWVALDTSADPGVVRAILPRAGVLSRRRPGAADQEQVVAANIDTVLIVEGLDRGPNPRRIERSLALAWDGGATPVVVLSKADLCSDPEAALNQARAGAPFSEIVMVSSATGDGFDQLAAHLGAATTAVLLGPSGAGKSSLSNRMLGEQRLAIGEVRDCDRRGRHTTTHRELVVLPSGACLIDTPGIRELGLWLAAAAINAAFSEIEALAADCRFRDCRHQSEPGCAVRAAAETGDIDPARLDSFLKLRHEAEALEVRRDAAQRHQVRARDRVFARLCRAEKLRKSNQRS